MIYVPKRDVLLLGNTVQPAGSFFETLETLSKGHKLVAVYNGTTSHGVVVENETFFRLFVNPNHTMYAVPMQF